MAVGHHGIDASRHCLGQNIRTGTVLTAHEKRLRNSTQQDAHASLEFCHNGADFGRIDIYTVTGINQLFYASAASIWYLGFDSR
ncbi:hypothetical protein M5J15_07410 [Serratia symbiotica]|uniref:hypothetical protein n=1 Tax=Serratia symbiotica TaxID=138074 RepID=UPI0020910D81|nr:hypothetical protein [Serratia symbiotica]USS96624.1 hypothetical protein M5J15_07410 [Serratia symbiotica]